MCLARRTARCHTSEIAKGFEVSSGSYVMLSKEEIAAAEGPEAHVIDVEHFVDGQEIDPAYYERAYYLSPGKLGDEAYRTLHSALKASGRVGIGRFVFHGKAHLAAVRALKDVIVLHTMRFADEFVDPARAGDRQGRQAAEQARDRHRTAAGGPARSSFEPDAYENTLPRAVLGVIEQKARGEAIEAPQSQEQTAGGGAFERASSEPRREAPARKVSRPASGSRRTSPRAPARRERANGGLRATQARLARRGED